MCVCVPVLFASTRRLSLPGNSLAIGQPDLLWSQPRTCLKCRHHSQLTHNIYACVCRDGWRAGRGGGGGGGGRGSGAEGAGYIYVWNLAVL